MKYTVTWKPSAKGRLADIWLSAEDRAAIASAADRIDRLLASDPMDAGESRSGNDRILIASPLAVVFEVSELDCRVDVLAVRHVPRRPRDSG